MKRIFGKKAAAAAITVLISVSLVCTGCSDGRSSGNDDSGGGTGGGTTTKPTIADGTYCNGMLKVQSGHAIWCNLNATGTIEIPESVESFEDYAFQGCENLTSIRIPSTVRSVFSSPDAEDFTDYCTGLKEIIVDENNPDYSSVDGILFSKDKRSLLRCPCASENMTIPDGITDIRRNAFRRCVGLTTITIPASVTAIGEGVFCETDLESITIPNGVTEIKDSAFKGCKSLTNVAILGNVKEIGEEAFFGCKSLCDITIPDSVTKIGNHAFSYCAMTNLAIPGSVKKISYGAFASAALTDVTIPNSVTEIDSVAFADCENLTNVTIPASVTKIGSEVFRFCRMLESVAILGKMEEIGIRVFWATSFDHLKTIYVTDKDEVLKWTEEKIGRPSITVKVIGE